MAFSSDIRNDEGKKRKDSKERVHGWVDRRLEIARGDSESCQPKPSRLLYKSTKKMNTACAAETDCEQRVCCLVHIVFPDPLTY